MTQEILKFEDRTEYRVNGVLHRENGPAIEWSDGAKSWWVNGVLHREDGPAVEWSNGTKEWWVNGVRMTEKKFKNQAK